MLATCHGKKPASETAICTHTWTGSQKSSGYHESATHREANKAVGSGVHHFSNNLQMCERTSTAKRQVQRRSAYKPPYLEGLAEGKDGKLVDHL